MRVSNASGSAKRAAYGTTSEETNHKQAKLAKAGAPLEDMEPREAGEEVTGEEPGTAIDAPKRQKMGETRK